MFDQLDERQGTTTLGANGWFDPDAPALLLTHDRLAARTLMTTGEKWRIAKYERRLARCLTPQEELAALAEERELENDLRKLLSH